MSFSVQIPRTQKTVLLNQQRETETSHPILNTRQKSAPNSKLRHSKDRCKLGLNLNESVSVTLHSNQDRSMNPTVLVRNESSLVSPQGSMRCYGPESSEPVEHDSDECVVEFNRSDTVEISYEENDLSNSGKPSIQPKTRPPERSPLSVFHDDKGNVVHQILFNGLEDLMASQFIASRAYLFDDDGELLDQYLRRRIILKEDRRFESYLAHRCDDIWLIQHSGLGTVYVEALANTETVLLVTGDGQPYMIEFCWMREQSQKFEEVRLSEPLPEVQSTQVPDLQEEAPRPGWLKRFLDTIFGCCRRS